MGGGIEGHIGVFSRVGSPPQRCAHEQMRAVSVCTEDQWLMKDRNPTYVSDAMSKMDSGAALSISSLAVVGTCRSWRHPTYLSQSTALRGLRSSILPRVKIGKSIDMIRYESNRVIMSYRLTFSDSFSSCCVPRIVTDS